MSRSTGVSPVPKCVVHGRDAHATNVTDFNSMRLVKTSLIAAFLTAFSLGGTPQLSSVVPPGGQRGQQVPVTLEGARLTDVKDILFYDSDIKATRISGVNDTDPPPPA